MRECQVCGDSFSGKAYRNKTTCQKCYRRALRISRGLAVQVTAQERFWEKVERVASATDCWEWTGRINRDGYGEFAFGRGRAFAHRFSYALAHGDIPADLTIDHLCRNRSCVNPDHLEAVSKKVNTLRGIGPTAVNARKTHCLHGHPFDVENTRVDANGRRSCRACNRAAVARLKARKEAR